MIYQPRNVQPSGVSIDGLLDNTFTMEIQTNSYVSAYQLLIVDFDNNEIYTGSKTTLTNYAYNGDILEIPVSASAVALSNGTNYKWRVRLYQPTADMLITYGLVQATSTTTTIYLQPNINIKAGMAITINSQTKTISSYNSDTGVAVVSSAFSSAPAVGTQYKIYSDFIETVPDYIVYARRTPAVTISNVPSSLTLKYHTFQGTYTQSDNVPIVYHKFDLYTKNDDGTISLVASSDKVYSANLSYTYDSFRTGNKYLIQMTVENDMGVITTTDMYEFNVSYDIVEYLQQPLALFDDKNNAVKVSWVTPVEHDATSFRSDAATGIIQDNNNTLTQATFEPGQSIGEGDVMQITNSDCELVIDGRSTQATRSGKNLFTKQGNATPKTDTTFWNSITSTTPESDGWCKVSVDNTNGTTTVFANQFTKRNTIDKLEVNKTYSILVEVRNLTMSGSSSTPPYLQLCETAKDSVWQGIQNYNLTIFKETNKVVFQKLTKTNFDSSLLDFRNFVSVPKGYKVEFEYRLMVVKGSYTLDTIGDYEPYGVMPSPDYPSEIENVKGKNLFPEVIDKTTQTKNGITLTFLENNKINLKGTSTATTAIDLLLKENTKITKDIYVHLRNNGTGSASIALLNSSGQFGWCGFSETNKISKLNGVSSESSEINRIRFFVNTGQTIDITFQPSLEYTSDITRYVPYGNIQIVETGKNIAKFDQSKNTNINSWIYTSNVANNITATKKGTGDSFYATFVANVVKDEQYVFSTSTSNRITMYCYSDKLWGTGIKGLSAVGLSSAVPLKFTSNYTGQMIIGLYGTTTSVEAKDFQLKKGHTATNYEPYTEEVVNIDLKGNELCSLPNGTKDEVNITNGEVSIVKRTKEFILDENKKVVLEKVLTNTTRFLIYDVTSSMNDYPSAISTHFKYLVDYNSDTEHFYITRNGAIYLFVNKSIASTVDEFKTWLSKNNVKFLCELAEPEEIDLGDVTIPYINGINYMHISSNMDTTFSLVYPHKTISGNAYDYTEFNPPGVKQTGTIKSYNALTGVGTLMAQYPFTYIPMQGDSYVVISNIYNVSGFSYLYNIPYNTVNSLYTHGYTATWNTPDGLCVLPDDFNITLQFSPDGNFFYDQNGVYQEVVDLITTETDGTNSEGEFTIKIDKNKLIFVQNPDISLELPFYTNTTQVFVLSSASIAQINNDYVWDDTATWTDTYTWVEGGTSLERVCNHWWKVQITNTGIKIEEIFPTT